MWFYQGSELDESLVEEYVGFVYKITNTLSGRMYIGKKLFKFSRTKKTKTGKRKRSKVESDWKTYYGSNDELNKDVEVLGSSNFKREILHLCKSKGVANYLEMKEQVINGVLESDEWYNNQIRCRCHRSHISKKHT